MVANCLQSLLQHEGCLKPEGYIGISALVSVLLQRSSGINTWTRAPARFHTQIQKDPCTVLCVSSYIQSAVFVPLTGYSNVDSLGC